MKEFKYFNLSSAEKRQLTETVYNTLNNRQEIAFAYLYGSFIDKSGMPVRDIDIAIYINPEKIAGVDEFKYLADVVFTLKKNGIFLPIDIQIVNQAPIGFLHHVFAAGILLFYRDEELLTDLIEKTTRRHFEAIPFVKRYLYEY